MAQTLNEEGHGVGNEMRLASQHLTNYQNMVKTVREKLRTCQLALQEHLTLEEALQSMWSWVKEVQDKLTSSESTVGSKATLERRLTQIQVKKDTIRDYTSRSILVWVTSVEKKYFYILVFVWL